ncbi:hypothetical protein VOLCADRAFT_88609 [Volvox carteri f. nagariensis]|uniref:Uncharacterized protein n=1 Tax=Volvox carteri f. nagariensis TaxID=3068 RepID=D8TPG5_VOLCA|nr:uncharacterized protein VOLCADRAFT_88609 [Volvox carteri f. nagariensis]EFJ50759.1 hypothetical protein VOLCADRAFT_88609 [Volvox carteri f. nagariensis]|eukprot:XP_002948352.1 hypothetical protein VOLCADRAFT_88609 [Volvox carteri f. nagariensis]
MSISSQSQQPPSPHTGGLRDDPGHELATGGLYESARKDREAVPNPVPGSITQQTASQVTDTAAPEEALDSQGMPANSYPVHQDPAASQQHPTEAFRSPAEGAATAAQRSQPPPADRDVEGPVPPSSNVEPRADVHGVTHGSPPEDVQRDQDSKAIMITHASSSAARQSGSAELGNRAHQNGDFDKSPTQASVCGITFQATSGTLKFAMCIMCVNVTPSSTHVCRGRVEGAARALQLDRMRYRHG